MRWQNGKFTDGVTTVYSAEKVLMNKNTVTLSEEDEKTARFLFNRKRQSYAKDCEHDFTPPNKNLKYLPYQKAGIEYMRKVKRCLLADDQGLGKTIQICGLINETRDTVKNILIVCPASLKQNWKKEIIKWCNAPEDAIQILEGRKAKVRRLEHIYLVSGAHNVTIVNYDVIHFIKDELKKTDWHLIALDEAQYLKNPEAKRTIATMEICKLSDRVVAMSGTPMLNRPIDLWPLLTGLFSRFIPLEFKKQEKFGRYFCAGWLETIRKYDAKLCRAVTKKVWNYRGSSHLETLNTLLRERFMIRRLKKDVLPQLPDKRRQIIDLSVPKSLRKVLELQNEYQEEVIRAIETGKRMPPLEGQASVRKELALEKVKPSLEFINNILSNDESVVVFCHHSDVAEQLKESLCDFGVSMITGKTPQKARNGMVEDFQSGKNKVFIGNIQAAGTGLTLTKASNMVFVECSWVPGENLQAEDREHRIGQKSAVNIYYLIWGGSLDAQIIKTSLKKQMNINKVMK